VRRLHTKKRLSAVWVFENCRFTLIQKQNSYSYAENTGISNLAFGISDCFPIRPADCRRRHKIMHFCPLYDRRSGGGRSTWSKTKSPGKLLITRAFLWGLFVYSALCLLKEAIRQFCFSVVMRNSVKTLFASSKSGSQLDELFSKFLMISCPT
jgi:hypothetical protein